jgi:hypothetical protein
LLDPGSCIGRLCLRVRPSSLSALLARSGSGLVDLLVGPRRVRGAHLDRRADVVELEVVDIVVEEVVVEEESVVVVDVVAEVFDVVARRTEMLGSQQEESVSDELE